MTDVEIRSADSAARLTFSDFDGAFFTAALNSPTLRTEVRVYAPRDFEAADVAGLIGLFKKMSENWKGWKGKLTWASLEGELEIVATSDSLGHTTLELTFRQHDGPLPWSSKADFLLESMQVETAYKGVAQLFS